MNLKNLTTDDLPILRHFHPDVRDDFARRIEKAQNGTLDDVFRLACDIHSLETAGTRDLKATPTAVVFNKMGHVVTTNVARDVSYSVCVSLLEEAARKGHIPSAYMAGWHYYVGKGRDQDKDFGVNLLTLAARAGHAPSQEYLEAIRKPRTYTSEREGHPTVFRHEEDLLVAPRLPKCVL